MITADFHIHSTASDGTDAPAEILRKIDNQGIKYFSLTDHDTDKGCVEIEKTVREYPGIQFTRGVEFSCRDAEGRMYHILGYGFSSESESIKELILDAHRIRMEKIEKRIRFLADQYAFTFTDEDITALLAKTNPGKPHLAALMISDKYKYAKDWEEAMAYLNLHKGEAYIQPERAIKAVSEAGGVPVLAHAVFGSGSQNLSNEEVEFRVRSLKDYGISGLECFYSKYSEQQESMLLSMADKYGLCATGGSDYHGKNKKVSIGQHGLTEEKMRLPAVRKFMEKCFS